MSEGNAHRGGDELPPDPWAGLADPTPSPPPPGPGERGWGDPRSSPGVSGPASRWQGHPSVTPGTPSRHVPPPRSTLWHHPAVWVVLLILAGVLLLSALLEPRPKAPDPGPASDSVSALLLEEPVLEEPAPV